MMNKLRSKHSRGFTLIELMIVIAIIGVLAAIAVPNFNKARAQAKLKSCIANMKTIEGAVELYNMENATKGGNIDIQNDLVKNGYLKAEPKCPVKNSQYKANVDTTSGKTDVECPDHGLKLSEINDENKIKQALQK